MAAESFLLTGFCFVAWILWVPAVLIQKKAAGEGGGTSIAPVIPIFPGAAGVIGIGLNLWISHLGTWIIGTIHAMLALLFIFTVVLGLIKIRRMSDETAGPTG